MSKKKINIYSAIENGIEWLIDFYPGNEELFEERMLIGKQHYPIEEMIKRGKTNMFDYMLNVMSPNILINCVSNIFFYLEKYPMEEKIFFYKKIRDRFGDNKELSKEYLLKLVEINNSKFTTEILDELIVGFSYNLIIEMGFDLDWKIILEKHIIKYCNSNRVGYWIQKFADNGFNSNYLLLCLIINNFYFPEATWRKIKSYVSFDFMEIIDLEVLKKYRNKLYINYENIDNYFGPTNLPKVRFISFILFSSFIIGIRKKWIESKLKWIDIILTDKDKKYVHRVNSEYELITNDIIELEKQSRLLHGLEIIWGSRTFSIHYLILNSKLDEEETNGYLFNLSRYTNFTKLSDAYRQIYSSDKYKDFIKILDNFNKSYIEELELYDVKKHKSLLVFSPSIETIETIEDLENKINEDDVINTDDKTD